MTTEEFSNEFDILLNSYSQNSSSLDINLDEYEKSVFLTNAQEMVFLSLYNGNNEALMSFEETEEARRYINTLIKTLILSTRETNYTGLSKESVFFKLPLDLWFITYESVSISNSSDNCIDKLVIPAIPTTLDEYSKIRNNPFRRSNKRRVLRFDVENQIVELISKYNIESYLIRYISKLKPIILIDLPDNLSIDGIKNKTECELNPILHRVILERAVKLALASKTMLLGK